MLSYWILKYTCSGTKDHEAALRVSGPDPLCMGRRLQRCSYLGEIHSLFRKGITVAIMNFNSITIHSRRDKDQSRYHGYVGGKSETDRLACLLRREREP
jgi:hypothetical protein